VTVSAAGMWDGCNDQGSHPRLPPLKDQLVTLTMGSNVVELGHVSADPDTGLAQIKVTIPATTAAGTMRLAIGIAQPAEIVVTAK